MPSSNGSITAKRIRIGRVTIYRRGKKGIWTAEYHRNGQHVRESLHTEYKKEAEDLAADINARLISGKAPALHETTSITIGEAIEKFITAKQVDGRSKKTLTKYRTEIENFERFATEHNVFRVQDISPDLYDKYRKQRADQIDTYTAYNHGIILITLLKWCRSRHLICENPLDGYKLTKPRRRHHMAPTLAQVNSLLSAADDPVRTILATLAFTGMRVGELQQLQPRHLDLDGGWIHIVSREDWLTKTGNSRKVPIHPRLRSYLQSLPHCKRPLVFSMPTSGNNTNGYQPVDEGKLNDAAKELAASAGLPIGRKVGGFVVHSLRHFFLTYCLNARVPKYAVDYWVGHTGDQSVGKQYYGLTDQELQELMNTVSFDKDVLPNRTSIHRENQNDSQQ
jgi:integrase